MSSVSARVSTLAFATALFVSSAVVFPGTTRADDAGGASDTDKAMAQSLFDAGRALMSEGKTDAACPKFEESDRLDPSAGTLLNLGKCYEALGRTASAWAAYKRTVTVGKSTGQSRQVDAALEFIDAIEPKLSKLVVDFHSTEPGLVVRRFDDKPGAKGIVISDASRGVPLAVDPGDYRIEADAPGFERWVSVVHVGPGGAPTAIAVPSLRRAPDTSHVPPTDATKTSPRSKTLRLAGAVVGGTGIALLGVGTGLGIVTLHEASTAESDPTLCPGKRCTPRGQDYVDAAKQKGIASSVTLAVGGAATAVAVVLVVLSLDRGKEKRPAALTVTPLAASPSSWGLGLGGRL